MSHNQIHKNFSAIQTIQDIHDKCFQEGFDQGERRGQLMARIACAKKLKAKNFSLKEVCDITGLDADDIKHMRW